MLSTIALFASGRRNGNTGRLLGKADVQVILVREAAHNPTFLGLLAGLVVSAAMTLVGWTWER